MRFLALCTLQSALGVLGSGLLTIALHGRPMSVGSIMQAAASWPFAAGLVSLFGSFVVTAVILSTARLSLFVPVTTAMTFVFTIVFAVLVQKEAVPWTTWVGMAVILTGVWIVSAGARAAS